MLKLYNFGGVCLDTIDKIMELIKKKDRTQVNFVKNFNNSKVVKQTITDWKSGKSKSYNSIIKELSDYFNVPVDYLLNDSDETYQELSSMELELIAEFNKLDLKGKTVVMNTIFSEQERMHGLSISKSMKDTIKTVDNFTTVTKPK